MTRYDRDNGIVNVVVGFAPLRPAEFVIIGIGSSAKDPSYAAFVSRRYRIRTGRYALRVAWDGQVVKGVTRVRGLAQLTELMNVHQGGDPASSQVIVGKTKFEPVTLERAVTPHDDAFETWADAIRASGPGGGTPPPRKDVRIELHDGERRQTIAWLLKGALPVKFQAPDFNTAGNDVAMEELTLAYESLAREDDPPA